MRTFATVLAVLAVSLTFAQGAGPGGGQGRPGGGQGRMGAGMMQESRVTLLMRPDVQQELKITAEQREKIQAVMPQRQQGGGQAGAGQQGGGQAGAGQGRGQGGGQGGGQGAGAQMGEINAKIKEVLTPEQWERLTGLYIQRAGNSSVMEERIEDSETTDPSFAVTQPRRRFEPSPSGSASTTASRTPSHLVRAAVTSPSSMRTPRTFNWSSILPRKSRFPSGRNFARSPVR